MKQLLDYDPASGISTYFVANDDEFRFVTEQDKRIIESALDANKRDANDDDKTKRGIKNDMWKYAHVPAMTQLEWLQKYGVIFGNKEHWPRVYELLNSREYRHLKTTSKYHTVK